MFNSHSLPYFQKCPLLPFYLQMMGQNIPPLVKLNNSGCHVVSSHKMAAHDFTWSSVYLPSDSGCYRQFAFPKARIMANEW